MECKTCLFTDDIVKIMDDGDCEYCKLHDKLQSQSNPADLGKVIEKIKKSGKQYDCLIGISGGLDSSALLYAAVKNWNLKPLVIHFDNGWNNEQATNNMNALINKLNVNAIIYKVDKKEYDLLNDSFLWAGVPDADIPNDIAMTKLMYETADKYGIKYILNGHDFRTEGSTPAKWTYMDAKYIRSVYRAYTGTELKNYPLFTFKDQLYYALKGIKQVRPYHYGFFREKLEMDMKSLIKWQDYGGKHCENVYTEFVGSHLLPNKFKINKTIVYLSAQIRSGKINKSDAKEILQNQTPFDLKKLGNKHDGIMALTYRQIGERDRFEKYNFKKLRPLIWLLAKLKVVPYTFYKKYCF